MIASLPSLRKPVGYGAGYYSFKVAEVLERGAIHHVQTSESSAARGARFRGISSRAAQPGTQPSCIASHGHGDPIRNALLEQLRMLTARRKRSLCG